VTDPVFDPADPVAFELLREGEIEVEGRLIDASNVTLFCTINWEKISAKAVYKPVSGERPLWDFPDGTLAGREVATYLISSVSGLGNVPPTVLRDGPFGPGMVQLWVDTIDDPLVDVQSPNELSPEWLVVLEAEDQAGNPAVVAHSDNAELRELAALDVVVNNTDRKGGHLLNGSNGRIYGIDHGICLHTEPKLRTVLWGWIGQPLPDSVAEKLRVLSDALTGDLGEQLIEHITTEEINAATKRAQALLDQGVFPTPENDRNPIPWPLF